MRDDSELTPVSHSENDNEGSTDTTNEGLIDTTKFENDDDYESADTTESEI